MAKLNQIYKCAICGNITEVVHAGGGELVCCGQPMLLLTESKHDEGQEKHVPIIEKTENGTLIKVGSVPHPMTEDHYIEWIEVMIGDKIIRRMLKPGEPSELEICTQEDNITARTYCNIHELWSN